MVFEQRQRTKSATFLFSKSIAFGLCTKTSYSKNIPAEVRAAAEKHLEEKRKQDQETDERNEENLSRSRHNEPQKDASRQGIITLTHKQHRKLLEAVREKDPGWRKIIPSRSLEEV